MPQPKPPLTPRRPLTPRSPAEAVEAFVSHGPERPGVPAPVEPSQEFPRGPGLVRRASGRVRRRMTVYLPPELARELALHAVTQGEDVSDIVAAAVAKHLEGAR